MKPRSVGEVLAGWFLGGLVLLGQRTGGPGRVLVHVGFGLRHRLGMDRPPRTLVPRPSMAGGSRTASNVVVFLDRSRKSQRYLEIGVFEGRCLEAVPVPLRIGVDPNPLVRVDAPMPRGTRLHRIESDRYFAQLPADECFDAVLVDGLHQFQQAYRDVISAAQHLRPRGFILVDDVVPSSDQSATPVRIGTRGDWMGDVFRAVLAIADLHADVLDWRTFERPAQRFQTVLWAIGPAPRPASQDRLARFECAGFSETFARGVPEPFRLTSREGAVEALEAARRAMFPTRPRDS